MSETKGGGLLLVDDVDKPPPASPGRHPLTPIGYEGQQPLPRRGRLPAQVWIIITCAVLLPIAVALWFFVRWLDERPMLAELLGWIAWGFLLVLIAAAAYLVAGWVRTFVGERQAQTLRQRVERSRFGVPFDVGMLTAREPLVDAEGRLIGWRPAYDFAALEQMHLAYETAGWQYKAHPMLTTRTGGDTTIDTKLEPPLLPAPAGGDGPPVETLDDLERRGIIRASDHSLFIGFGNGLTGDPINWAWSHDGGAGEPVIVAVAGAPGSGKSQTAAQITLFALRKGVDVYIFDPQRDSGEQQTLAARLGPAARGLAGAVAADEHELEQLVEHVEQIGRNRERGIDTSRAPVLAVIEEFSGTLLGFPNKDHVIELICRCAQKYRKFGIRFLLVGPSWKSNLVGGELGTTLASLIRLKIMHAMSPAEAAFLTYGLDKSQKQAIEAQQPGNAIVYGAGVYKPIAVPNLMPRLALDVAQRLTPRAVPAVVWSEPAVIDLGAPTATAPADPIAAELRSRLAGLNGASREQKAGVLLLARTPARVRGRWAYRVKDVARALAMSDPEIAVVASRVGRGTTGEG